MKPPAYCGAAVLLVIFGGCRQGSGDALLRKWTNHDLAAKQPAILSIEFLPKSTATVSAIDTLGAVGWHSPTTSTGKYQVIAPNRLKITEELGSAVFEYHIDGARLVLSGDGLAQLLGKREAPQMLDNASQ